MPTPLAYSGSKIFYASDLVNDQVLMTGWITDAGTGSLSVTIAGRHAVLSNNHV